MKKNFVSLCWIIVLTGSIVVVKCDKKRQIQNLQFPQNDGSTVNGNAGSFGSTSSTPFGISAGLPGQSSNFDSSTANPFGYSNQPPISGYYNNNNNDGINTNQFPSSNQGGKNI